MTQDQKTYFAWLIMRNTQRIVNRAKTTALGTQIINSAYDKGRLLGIPYSRGMTQGAMRDQSIAMLGRLLGVRLQIVPPFGTEYELADLEEPF